MKSLIAIVGLVLCMVVCSHQLSLFQESYQYVVGGPNYTIYALSGSELSKNEFKCVNVNVDTVTFWKNGGCETSTKKMDELSSTELDLITIQPRFVTYKHIGPGSTLHQSKSENRHIEIGINSTVSLTNSSSNRIVVGDNSHVSVVNSNRNFIRVGHGQSVTLTNEQRKSVYNQDIKPLGETSYGNDVEFAVMYNTTESNTVKTVVKLSDYVAFLMRDGLIQMKPIECLDEQEKMLAN